MDESVTVATIVVVCWIISVCFHEYAHALVAYIGGDSSVKSKGYLNFNPFAYTDIRLSIIVPTLLILIGGIGLPGASVQIREDQLRHRYWSSLVAAAGPFATFLFAVALALIIRADAFPDIWLLSFSWLLNLEIIVLILNLMPVPGLDGFGIIEPFMSRKLRAQCRPFYKNGIWILMGVLWLYPPANHFLWDSASTVIDVFGISSALVDRGHALYQKGMIPVAIAVVAIASTVYFLKKNSDWFGKAEKLLKEEKYNECLAIVEAALLKAEDAKAYRISALCYAGLLSKEMITAGSSANSPVAVNLSVDEKIAEAASATASGAAPITKYKAAAYLAADKCIALEPKAFENYLAKGLVAETVGDAEIALEAYGKSMELNSENSYAFTRYCNVLWTDKRFEELLATAEKRLARVEDDGDATFQRAVALAQLGRHDEAVACFGKCIRQGVQRELSQKNMEIILAKKNKPQ